MRAVQAQQQGRNADAVREAEAALGLRPDHAVAHNILGIEAIRREENAAARQHFAAATRADPSSETLWLNLAKAHSVAGDDEAEAAAIESALAIDQQNLMALIQLAQLHERRGELGKAATRWAAVATLAAQHVSPSANLSPRKRPGLPPRCASSWTTISRSLRRGTGAGPRPRWN
jgi:Tfp pilus assembly protein PilF